MGRRRARIVEPCDEEQQKLRALAGKTRDRSGLAQRASIVLMAATGASNGEIARRHEVSLRTVAKWRNAFAEEGLVGLDGRVSVQAMSSELRDFERVVMAVRAAASTSHEDPSTRTLSRLIGVGQSTVSRIRRCLAAECPLGEQALAQGNHFTALSFGGLLGLFMEHELSAVALRVAALRADDRMLTQAPQEVPSASQQLHTAARHARFWSRAYPATNGKAFEGWIMETLRTRSVVGGQLAIVVSCSSPQLSIPAEEAIRRFGEVQWLVAPSDSGWFRALDSWLACQARHDENALETVLSGVRDEIAAMGASSPRLKWTFPGTGEAARHLLTVPSIRLDTVRKAAPASLSDSDPRPPGTALESGSSA